MLPLRSQSNIYIDAEEKEHHCVLLISPLCSKAASHGQTHCLCMIPFFFVLLPRTFFFLIPEMMVNLQVSLCTC